MSAGRQPVVLIGLGLPYRLADSLLDVSDLVRRPVARGGLLVECDLDLDPDHRLVFSASIDRTPHLLPALIGGYRGPRRGGGRGVLELDIGGFGAGTLSFLGDKLRPLLGGFALRAARPGE